jgi:hypothetical protein
MTAARRRLNPPGPYGDTASPIRPGNRIVPLNRSRLREQVLEQGF